LKNETYHDIAGEDIMICQFDAEDSGDVYLETLLIMPVTEPAVETTGWPLALMLSLVATGSIPHSKEAQHADYEKLSGELSAVH
jgi:hypothetical protein